MKKIFTPEFLAELGFYITKSDEEKGYGEAKSLRPRNMKILYWNNGGASCTYFGDKLESNVSFTLRTDGDTRTLFNGYAFSEDDVRKVFQLTA